MDLIGIAGIRRHLRPEPLQRTEAPRLPVRGEFNGDEVQDMGPGDLVDQGVTLTDRQGCTGVVGLAGADIEQRMGMGDWDLGLILNLAVSADRFEEQQAPILFQTNPGGAILLFWEEALDVAQPAPLTPD